MTKLFTDLLTDKVIYREGPLLKMVITPVHSFNDPDFGGEGRRKERKDKGVKEGRGKGGRGNRKKGREVLEEREKRKGRKDERTKRLSIY